MRRKNTENKILKLKKQNTEEYILGMFCLQ